MSGTNIYLAKFIFEERIKDMFYIIDDILLRQKTAAYKARRDINFFVKPDREFYLFSHEKKGIAQIEIKIRQNQVLREIKEEDVTLIIDSTNCNLGVFEDGKIYMFFNDTGNGMRATTLGNLLGFSGGENFGGIINLTEDQIKSMLSSKINVAELAEKYGVEAQNRALKEVQRMEGKEKIDFVRMLSPEVFKQAQQSVRENETSRESYNIIQETSEVSGVQKNQKSAEQKVNGAQEINETPSAGNTREENEGQDMER